MSVKNFKRINFSNSSFRMTALFIYLFCSLLTANDLIPGKKQTKPIVFTNARIFTVSAAIIEKGTLVFDKGKIVALGDDASVTIPQNAEIIDLQGKHVYPGLILGHSTLGLVEVGAVRSTKDFIEVGSMNPNARADVAYNPDSELIPTVRSNGVTTVVVAPGGGMISGTGSILSLDGWNIEDSMIKKNAGIFLNWPAMIISTSSRITISAEQQLQNIKKNIQQLEDFFKDAKAYALARRSDPSMKTDLRLEAMINVIDGTLPLIIKANEYKQIEAAVDFCKRHTLEMILLGGDDSWKLTELLVKNSIPVLLTETHRVPTREDEDYDIAFRRPFLLKQAGIKYCQIMMGRSGWTWNSRNLPFFAGSAVAHGLSEEDALKSITLWPAQIFGIDDVLGSLEIGKSATLIVSTGDVLDMQSSHIEMMFIDGRKVDLDNKHKRLYKKYNARYEQK